MTLHSANYAEKTVISGLMIDPQAFWKVADVVGAEDFDQADFRTIFEAVQDARNEGRDADPVTLAEAMPQMANRILEIANAAFSSATIRAHAEIVARKATARRVRAAGLRISKLPDDDAIGEAQRIMAACQPRATSAVRSIRSFMQDALGAMQQRVDAAGALTGIPTSLPWLDEQTSGWQRGDLIVLAARPSVGKTALALQCAIAAAKAEQPVFFASLEQSGAQLAERAISHLSGISFWRVMRPKLLGNDEWQQITDAGAVIKDLPIRIDETGALPVEAICARARQANATQRLGLIAIDYLTQITPPRAEKTADSIQIVTRALKALAKDLGVPVLLLSQLNRAGDEKPVLRNLRDSGAIEQDADVVIFLHRPDPANRGLVELAVAKQRNGPISETYLRADMDRMRFYETDERPATNSMSPTRGFRQSAVPRNGVGAP